MCSLCFGPRIFFFFFYYSLSTIVCVCRCVGEKNAPSNRLCYYYSLCTQGWLPGSLHAEGMVYAYMHYTSRNTFFIAMQTFSTTKGIEGKLLASQIHYRVNIHQQISTQVYNFLIFVIFERWALISNRFNKHHLKINSITHQMVHQFSND